MKSHGLPYPLAGVNSISLGSDFDSGRESYLSTGLLVTHADLGIQYSPYAGFSPQDHTNLQDSYTEMLEEIYVSLRDGRGDIPPTLSIGFVENQENPEITP